MGSSLSLDLMGDCWQLACIASHLQLSSLLVKPPYAGHALGLQPCQAAQRLL